MNLTEQINTKIDSGNITKTDLADKLGITRVTLNKRLISGNWKKGELSILKTI